MGHYTAFVRSSLDKMQWYHIDDNEVNERVRYSPAAEVGNPALLDKVFFTDYFALGYMQNIQVGVEFFTLGQLKIFKMAAAKRGRFVMEIFTSGRKRETSYFGLLDCDVFKFYGKNMFRP